MNKCILAAVLSLSVLMCSLLGARAVSAVAGSLPAAVMSAPAVIDESLTPGSTFSINITIANVEKLWGYQFALFYNTSVIDALEYTFIDPRFTLDLPSEIGTDYTALARGTYNGDPVGVTITDPIPVARIDFVVTGYGATSLHFSPDYTEMADVYAEGYIVFKGNLRLADGRFLNTQMLLTHDIAITQVLTSKTVVLEGDSVTITAVVTNQGNFTENMMVIFTANRTNIGSATISGLQPGGTISISFVWTTWSSPWPISRLYNYVIVAQASIVLGEFDTADNLFVDGVVTTFRWEYTFRDSARGTTLKINTKLRVFQFTTAQNDYGVKQDPNMDVRGLMVKIDYEDSEISLNSVSINARLALCKAIAFDKSTQTTYLLLQRIKP